MLASGGIDNLRIWEFDFANRKVRPNASLQDVFEPGKKRAEVLLLVDCKGMFDRGQAPQSAYRLVPIRNRR